MGKLMSTNHMAVGKATVKDADLIEMELDYANTLPWMTDLLNEVQFLRGGSSLKERIKYLEGQLDAVHAAFDA